MSGDDGLRSPEWSLRAAASARSRTSLEDKEEYLDLRRQDRDGGALQRLSRSPPPRPPSAVVDDHGRLVRELRRLAAEGRE